MAKCNTQANDMATTVNNWRTPGASDLGRYSAPLQVCLCHPANLVRLLALLTCAIEVSVGVKTGGSRVGGPELCV